VIIEEDEPVSHRTPKIPQTLVPSLHHFTLISLQPVELVDGFVAHEAKVNEICKSLHLLRIPEGWRQLNNEKIRILLERGKVKDYYDVWRLLKTESFDYDKVRKLFLQKCKAKLIAFNGVDRFFPSGLVRTLEPYLKAGLARLSADPLPPPETMIAELKSCLAEILS
jgi:hypothetical protein